MNYSESAQGLTISKARAFKEVCSHGLQSEWLDCLEALLPLEGTKLNEDGNITEVLASDVLAWLGY